MQEELNIQLYLNICDARKAIGLPVDEKCESLARQCLNWKTVSCIDNDNFNIVLCIESDRDKLMQYIKQKYYELKGVRN